ncbi:hypothetical protein [Nonomuraea sp. NPDC052265]|uniref:hypothetical protein n=1 Tax=Nonomuraea sp. NPDC052265 TaxID=3364374 RepID=UPI0037CB9F50
MAPLDQPGVGPHLAPCGPLLLDGRQIPPSPAPELGEHTDEVLADLLSLSPPELASLRGRRRRLTTTLREGTQPPGGLARWGGRKGTFTDDR